MKAKGWRKWPVVWVLAGLLVAPTACDLLEEELFWLLGTEWLDENRTSVARRTVTGSTGDAETDAALEPWDVVEAINEADLMMQVGRRDRDGHLMKQAIDKRPGDWTYRVTYGALLLDQGDLLNARPQFEAADALAQSRGPSDQLRYANQGIAELTPLDAKWAQGSYGSAQCEVLFDRLAYYYQLRSTLTGSDEDKRLATQYTEDAKRCKQ